MLDLARLQHAETASELERAKAIDRAATDHYLSWKNGWLLRHLRKKRFAALAEAAEDGTARRVELEEQEVLARLGTQIDIPDAVATSFSRFSDAFAQLSRSSRIWDTVSHRAVNQVSERTLASRAIERKPVQFRLGTCAAIQSDWQVPHLENANGGDLYLYPLFIVYFAGERNFALLEYKDVELREASTRFIEAEAVPHDSKIVDRTWAKTNKDGSPDRRFKENYEIPVVQYGKLSFHSATGLNEEYMFSNAAATETFSKEWNSLVQGIARGS